MISRRCGRCGASSFRADRSLAGRLVCTSCGTPAGQAVRSSHSRRLPTATPVQRWGLWFLLLLVVVVIVLLLQSA